MLEYAGFFLVGLLGMTFHWLKKWARGEIQEGFNEYYFHSHRKNSFYALLVYIGAFSTIALSGSLDGENLKQTLLLLLSTGFNADSIANKGTPTEEVCNPETPANA